MLTAILLATLAQTPAPPAAATGDRPRVLVLDLEAGGGVDAQQAKLINGLLTESMSRFDRFEVISSADVRQLVDVEANKSAAGCDTSSCLAEIGGALGARWVVFGNIGKLGNLTLLTLSLFDTAQAKPVGRQRVEARDVETLPGAIDRALGALIGEPAPAAPAPALSPLLIGGGVAAAVGVVGAVGLGAYALALDDGLSKPETAAVDKETALDVGPWVIAGAAGSALVAVVGGGLVAASMVME